MSKLQDLIVFENEVVLGKKLKRLRWNNDAIAQAVVFTRGKYSAIEILQSIAKRDLYGLQALIYGARRAADRDYTKSKFIKDFDFARIEKYSAAATEGVTYYLPHIEQGAHSNGEAAERQGTDFIDEYIFLARKALCMTGREILEASLRSISAMVETEIGEETAKDEYYGDEISWL